MAAPRFPDHLPLSLQEELRSFLELQRTTDPRNGAATKAILKAFDKKGTVKVNKKELSARLARAEKQLATAGYNWNRGVGGEAEPATAEAIYTRVVTGTPSLEQTVTAMKATADEAERRGDVQAASTARRRLTVLKMMVQEWRRQERPTPSRLGPGSVQLFERTGTLDSDPDLGGV